MPSVLVVDDEEAIRRLIRETLEQAGYHVHEAADGKEGLDSIPPIARRLGDHGHPDA